MIRYCCEYNEWNLEPNAEKSQGILNRIVRIITTALGKWKQYFHKFPDFHLQNASITLELIIH